MYTAPILNDKYWPFVKACKNNFFFFSCTNIINIFITQCKKKKSVNIMRPADIGREKFFEEINVRRATRLYNFIFISILIIKIPLGQRIKDKLTRKKCGKFLSFLILNFNTMNHCSFSSRTKFLLISYIFATFFFHATHISCFIYSIQFIFHHPLKWKINTLIWYHTHTYKALPYRCKFCESNFFFVLTPHLYTHSLAQHTNLYCCIQFIKYIVIIGIDDDFFGVFFVYKNSCNECIEIHAKHK